MTRAATDSNSVLPPTLEDPLAAYQPSLAALFPLPLTIIETFMVADASPEYPMLCDLRLRIQGTLDRQALHQGLMLGLARAPLFRSCIERDGRGRWVWRLSDKLPSVDWAPMGTPLGAAYGSPLDLTQEPGLRIWVRVGNERSEIVLHFHHASADALGGFAFIEDFLAGYAATWNPEILQTLRPWEPTRLLDRKVPHVRDAAGRRALGDALTGAREAVKFFLQRPAALPPVHTALPEEPADQRRLSFHTGEVPSQVFAGLRTLAQRQRVTVNDILLRDAFLALRQWIGKHEPSLSGRALRILMPQNLRHPSDRAMPASNHLGFAFVTRAARWFGRPDELLASIAEETEAVRRGRLSRYFLDGLASLDAAGLLEWLLRRRLCFATAVLSNLGDPFRRFVTRFPRCDNGLVVGDMVVEGIDGVPPLRPGTRAACCVSTGGQRMSVSLRCDPSTYRAEDARALLAEFTSRLETTAHAAAER